jgi:hypothetical protein
MLLSPLSPPSWLPCAMRLHTTRTTRRPDARGARACDAGACRDMLLSLLCPLPRVRPAPRGSHIVIKRDTAPMRHQSAPAGWHSLVRQEPNTLTLLMPSLPEGCFCSTRLAHSCIPRSPRAFLRSQRSRHCPLPPSPAPTCSASVPAGASLSSARVTRPRSWALWHGLWAPVACTRTHR